MGQYPVPVVILVPLAVPLQFQGLGIGMGLLQDAVRPTLLISEQAGFPARLTPPMDEDAARLQRMPRNNADVGLGLRLVAAADQHGLASLVTGQFVPLVQTTGCAVEAERLDFLIGRGYPQKWYLTITRYKSKI